MLADSATDTKERQEQQTVPEGIEISVLNSKLSFLSSQKDKTKDLSQIEKEFEIISKKLKPAFQVSKEVGKYYCLLSSVYSSFINSDDKDDELNRANLEKAKEYQANAEKTLPTDNPDLCQASCDLAVAYNNHAMKTKVNTKLSVLFLQTALNLQHKYCLDTTITQIHLGISYHNRAEEFLSRDHASAMQDYENAILMTPTIEENNPHIKDKLEQLCILGLSHDRLGKFMSDESHSKKANYYFALYLAHSDKSDRYYPVINRAMKDCLGSTSKCRV